MLIARVGAHNPEYWDDTRKCWTGHPHKATEFASELEAQDVIISEGLEADDAYLVE